MRNDKQNWRQEYPFHSHYHRINRHHLHYIDEGVGEPLLLVHGNPTWSFYWRRLVSALADTRRVVAPDHLGCGLSDKPLHYSYRLSRHVSNLVALIDSLDLAEITLVAHDWGGPIGLGAALKRLERMARLILLNTGAFPPPYCPMRIRLCRTPLFGRLAVQGGNAFARAALWMAAAEPRRLSATARQGLLAPYDTWSARIGIQRFIEDIPLSKRHPTYRVLERLEQQLPSLSHLPAAFIWGTQDWCFTPICLERLLQIFPQAQTHRLEDVGHYVMEEAPERVIEIVRKFLETNPLPKFYSEL